MLQSASSPTSPLGPGEPSIWRIAGALVVLATPIIASMVSRTVMSFVDFVMVSELGTEAQAAIMPAGIMLFTVMSFAFGVLSVINSFVAQSLGRGLPEDTTAYAWQGIWISAVMSLAVLPAYFAVPSIFAWIGHAPVVQAMEVSYTQIGILGFFPALASAALSNFFNGIHKPAVGFWAALAGNLFNVVGNYALIFGHFGFPALGIAGAAIATQLAGLVQMLILLGWMLRPAVARAYGSWRTWRPDAARLRAIFWHGAPAGVQFSADIISWAVFTTLLVGRFGTAQLAANNLCFKLLEMSFMPTVGLGVALTAAVGKAVGERRPWHARRVTRCGLGIGIVWMGLIALLYLVAGDWMVNALTDDPEVARWAKRILWFCAVFQVFDAVGIIHVNALRGAGDNHWPALVSATYALTLFLGMAWVVSESFPQWQSLGPWGVGTGYIIVLGLTLWARWRWGPWERMDLLGDAKPAVPAAVT